MIVHIFVCIASLFLSQNLIGSAVPSNADVHKDYFPYYVRVEGDKILANHNIDLNIYSYEIKQNYEITLNKAVKRLNNVCWGQGFLFVDIVKLQDIATEEINDFVKFIETLVLSTDLDSAVNDAVCDLLHKNGLVKNDVFKKSETEYNSRYASVKNKLNSTMLKNYRNYVTKSEIEKAVKNEFTVFVARMKKEKARDDLKAAFDKIKFKDETCSICLCEFTRWQEVGVLPCGHFFHGDCIRQALDKSATKCPLCRAFAVKSDIKIEYVPLL